MPTITVSSSTDYGQGARKKVSLLKKTNSKKVLTKFSKCRCYKNVSKLFYIKDQKENRRVVLTLSRLGNISKTATTAKLEVPTHHHPSPCVKSIS